MEPNKTAPNTQPTAQPMTGSDSAGTKLFTQEDVDRIIRERLERERKKTAPAEPTAAELKEKELSARENRLTCREYLLDRGYPADLLDVIDTSNPNEFYRKADIVSRLVAPNTPRKATPLASTEPAMNKFSTLPGINESKRTPRQYPPEFYKE